MKAKQLNALFFLVLFAFQSFWPTAAMALTDKGTQPEFASYEEVGTTEMVNLVTGNFSYGLPLVSVPSPEGSFDMAMAYHAGIQMDEESSWVGLGWSLNPGVLDRNVSIYPDDYDGTQQLDEYATVNSASGSGWQKTRIVYWSAYDSNMGNSSGVQLGNVIGFSNDASGVGGNLIGITKDRNGWSFNVDRFFRSVQEVGLLIADPPEGAGALVNGAWDLFGIGLSALQVVDALAASRAAKGAQGNFSPSLHMNQPSPSGWGPWSTQKYNYWFEGPSAKKALGVLYLGNIPKIPNFNYMPTSNGNGELIFNDPNNTWGGAVPANQPEMIGNVGGTATYHDYFVYYEQNKNLTDQRNPNSIAYDGFSVKAGGLSGAIAPYRLDAGSFAGTVLSQATQHYNFNVTPFLQNKTNTQSGYKVPFRYLGDPSNSYDYCLTTGTNGLINTNFRTNWDFTNSNYLQVSIFDPKIYYGRSATTGKEGDRSSTDPGITTAALKSDQIVHRRHLTWFSNSDIINGNTNNFLDCGINRSSFPVNGIGGFSITREDGMTYHFTIPVYNKTEYTKVYLSSGPDTYKVNNANPYATTWLLTAITGADFVDRGTAGVIDTDDWGYWVKLDYGMYNNNFSWRTPYSGYDVSATDKSQSFTRGTKQTYYLNTIKTRTHTAIFQKSVKNDGRSYYETDGDGSNPAEGETNDIVPVSVSNALKLDNVYILRNEDCDALVSSYGLGKLNANYNNALNWVNPTTDNIDGNVILGSDFSAAANNFIKSNQVKHIQFDYTYDLCKHTMNSWAVGAPAPSNGAFGSYSNASCTGKLTLKTIHALGPNDDRFMPTYDFDYNESTAGDNPDYDRNMQDDMGMYKSSNANGYSGTVESPYQRNCTPDGTQWSLRRITMPLGATVDIDYERDTYSSVNGKSNGWYPLTVEIMKPAGGTNITTVNANTFRVYTHPKFGNLNTYLKVGNLCNLSDTIGFTLPPPFNGVVIKAFENFNFLISAIDPGGTYLEFTSTDNTVTSDITDMNTNPWTTPKLIAVTGLDDDNPRYAGDLRVKSIVTTDELGDKYATQYDYHNSGVASFEPPTNQSGINKNEKLYDHPYLPIMYGQVTVSSGRIGTAGFEKNTSSVYKFITPDELYLTVDEGQNELTGTTTNNTLPWVLGGYHTNYGNIGHSVTTGVQHMKFRARSAHMIVKDKTNQIGQLTELTNYNSRDEAISQVKYAYTDGDNSIDYLGTQTEWTMGNYGETNFVWDYFNDPILSKKDKDAGNSNDTYYNNTYRLFQTSKIKYPCVLKSYTMKNGMVTAEQSYTQWDYFTGLPLEAISRTGGPTADDFTTTNLPAFWVYPEMGSKVMDPTYKNIMQASAQETQYVEVRNYILSSKVTTWSKDVKYRLYNSTTNKYEATAFPYSATQLGPYHPQHQYVWKSAVEKNGLVLTSNFVDFNWTTGAVQDARWIKISEATLYNKNSQLLEGINVNNKKRSNKYLNGNMYGIAAAPNCSYGEWCFSGAEDAGTGTGNEANYFGGEVSGTQYRTLSGNGSLAHTGSYSLKTPINGTGFGFMGDFGSGADFKPGRKYRASVWMHASNPQGRLYVKTGNSSGQLSYNEVYVATGSLKEKYGDWYLLNLDFTMPASMAGTGPYVQVSCYNPGTAGYVYFDDFRVQPLDAAIGISVVDTKTGDVVATLDEENIATRYYFDNTHFCTRIEKETKDGFKKMTENTRGFKR